MQKALDINKAARSLWGIAVVKANLAYFFYFSQGRINQQFQTSAKALRTAEESADIFSKGMAYGSHGVSCYGKRFLEEAEKHLLKGIELCERSNLHVWNAIAQAYLGETYFEMGEFQKAKAPFEKAYSSLEQNQLFPSWVGSRKIGAAARSNAINREKNVDLDTLYALAKNNRVKDLEGLTSRYMGEILLNTDDKNLSVAENWIHRATEEDQKNGMRFHLGRDYALYAEFFKRKGNCLKARKKLGRAIEILKECGADGWVTKYEREMASMP